MFKTVLTASEWDYLIWIFVLILRVDSLWDLKPAFRSGVILGKNGTIFWVGAPLFLGEKCRNGYKMRPKPYHLLEDYRL